MVLLPYRADMFSQLVINREPVVAFTLQVDDNLTQEQKGYLVLMTTFEGFASIPKDYYIENYTKETWDWEKNTTIYYKKREDMTVETIREETASILSLMFDEFDNKEEGNE